MRSVTHASLRFSHSACLIMLQHHGFGCVRRVMMVVVMIVSTHNQQDQGRREHACA
jgi:hypothetical protein